MKIHILQITTRANRDGDETHNIASRSLKGLRKKFRKYAEKNRIDEDYLDDEEFQKVIKDYLKNIDTETSPELNIAFFTNYFVVKVG